MRCPHEYCRGLLPDNSSEAVISVQDVFRRPSDKIGQGFLGHPAACVIDGVHGYRGPGRPVGPGRKVSAKPVEIYDFGIIEGCCSPHFHHLDNHILSRARAQNGIFLLQAPFLSCSGRASFGHQNGLFKPHRVCPIRNFINESDIFPRYDPVRIRPRSH